MSKNNFFQYVRIRVRQAGQVCKVEADLDKAFKRVKGIFLSFPEDKAVVGSCFGLKVAGVDVFDAGFEARMLTCNQSVSPQSRFFILPDEVPAAGARASIQFVDGAINPYLYMNGTDNTGVIDPAVINAGAQGAPVFTPPASNPAGVAYAYDLKVCLWLTNDSFTASK